MKNDYKINGDTTTIYLKKRKEDIIEAYIDTKDLDMLLSIDLKWNAAWEKRGRVYYVKSSEYVGKVRGKIKYVTHYLHREICGNPKMGIDHIDNNPLNNKRENLRLFSQDKNMKNRSGINSNNTSGYRNVSWIKGYWRVQLQVDGKNKLFPEKFDNVDLAGEFASKMRDKYYKD